MKPEKMLIMNATFLHNKVDVCSSRSHLLFHDVVKIVRAVYIIGALPRRLIWAQRIVSGILMRSLSLLEPLEVDISIASLTSLVSSKHLCPISSSKSICAVHQLLLRLRFGGRICTLKHNLCHK